MKGWGECTGTCKLSTLSYGGSAPQIIGVVLFYRAGTSLHSKTAFEELVPFPLRHNSLDVFDNNVTKHCNKSGICLQFKDQSDNATVMGRLVCRMPPGVLVRPIT